jgi:fluoride ion exporter CrcB/FEX
MLGCGLVGYLFSPLGVMMRLLMGISGILLLIPLQSKFLVTTILINILGALIGSFLIFFEWKKQKNFKNSF